MKIKKNFEIINGQKIQYTKFETENKQKTPVLILHGWDPEMNIEKSFGKLAQNLLEKNPDLEIFAPNLPGFGESHFSSRTNSAPSSGKNTFTSKVSFSTYDYADFIIKFCQKLKIENPIFITHSFGGRVLVRLLRKTNTQTTTSSSHSTRSITNPKTSDQITPDFSLGKLILIASAGIKWPLSPRQKISVFLSKKLKRAKGLLPQKIQKLIISKIFGARDWGAAPEDLRPTLKVVLAEPDFRDELPKIKNETLLLWGAQDTVTPLKSGQVFAKKLPNAKLEIFENGKHGIHRTHSKECAKAISNFLKE